MTNDEIAARLDRVADLLDLQEESGFRVRSYRRAAREIREAGEPVRESLKENGRDALEQMEGIGSKLAGAIEELVETGSLPLLERLESELTPEHTFAGLPGIGRELASRIHSQLGIDTLEELEVAAYDGRLAEIEGLGSQRIAGIRDALSGKLSRSARRQARQRTAGRDEPSVHLLLSIDELYRKKAERGELRKIAPKRFNPEGEAWLPLLHTDESGWSFTALYSNTARAHELGKTRDWVVIYYREESGAENQCTVVTAGSGPLKGKRVVRGREKECRAHYDLEN